MFDMDSEDEKLSMFDMDSVDEKLSKFDMDSVDEKLSKLDMNSVDEKLSKFDMDSVDEKLSKFDMDSVDEKLSKFDMDSEDEKLSMFDMDSVDEKLSKFDMDSVDEKLSKFDMDSVDEKLSKFDIDSEDEDSEVSRTKRKELVEKKSEVVHTALLDYHTIRVPPMVEYNSIESYCERKGESPLVGSDPPIFTLKCIGSPVVFRTPKPPPQHSDNPLRTRDRQPYRFFSVEELSFVKSLNNWTNLKVCPLGKLDPIPDTGVCYLNSVGEMGSWRILSDVSSMTQKPTAEKLLQAYGVVSIHEDNPIISVCFVCYLELADISLLAESYMLMEEYIPKYLNTLKSGEVGDT